jgi:hypothetical protein
VVGEGRPGPVPPLKPEIKIGNQNSKETNFMVGVAAPISGPICNICNGLQVCHRHKGTKFGSIWEFGRIQAVTFGNSLAPTCSTSPIPYDIPRDYLASDPSPPSEERERSD